MPNQFNAPDLRSDFIIVVNYDRPDMAAVALSYLFIEGHYLPIFSFQNVGIELNKNVEENDIFFIQRRRAEHFSVFLNNAIIENGGCENLIFLGLSKEQKSYLTFKHHYNVLDIETLEDIPAYLGGFGYDKGHIFECSINQLSDALILALSEFRILKIGNQNNDIIEIENDKDRGIVFIESIDKSNLIVSINYACSIGAKCIFLPKIDELEESEVLDLIELWQAGNLAGLEILKDKINNKIGHIDFSAYAFITFFTYGIPYVLLATQRPASMVNLEYRPDFFIFNNLVSERVESIGSAVVFSPSFFKNEETEFLTSLLEFRNFYLRKLIRKGASSYNLKSTIEGYPFDLLHICSHGGDVGGNNCLVKFRDENNVEHTIEFDHVLYLALTPFVDNHTVESYYYFRKLDNLKWRSAELKAKGYSKKLYASLLKEISNAFDKKKVINKGRIDRVANTNSIACAVPWNYKATFDQLGTPNVHPIIFNNSCWSWKTISTNFLVGGSRGYIGTLREIDNNKAVKFAKIFYDNTFNDNIINAFYFANVDFLKTNNYPIYVYWGLHFSTLSNIKPAGTNKSKVLNKLGESLGSWKQKLTNGEGSIQRLQRKVDDANWMIKDIVGTELEHSPK